MIRSVLVRSRNRRRDRIGAERRPLEAAHLTLRASLRPVLPEHVGKEGMHSRGRRVEVHDALSGRHAGCPVESRDRVLRLEEGSAVIGKERANLGVGHVSVVYHAGTRAHAATKAGNTRLAVRSTDSARIRASSVSMSTSIAVATPKRSNIGSKLRMVAAK